MMGLMTWHSVAFWPKCQECSYPMRCLLFTLCLRDGVVTVNGTNMCQNYVPFTPAMKHQMMNTINVTEDDLACYRPEVWCSRLWDLDTKVMSF